MSGDGGETNKATPLTKRKKTGELYARRPEVEAQLQEIASLPIQEIISRLDLPNRETPGYLYDETLVYLARNSTDENSKNDIYGEINLRFWLLIRKSGPKFESKDDMEEIGQQIEMVLIRKIFDPESDKGDYAQINFGDFVATELKSQLRKYHKRVNAEKTFEEIDKESEDSHGLQLPATGLNDLEKQEISQMLNLLPDHIREAAVLHFLDGWQIESKDRHEPTVSRKMGVSSRTIRNWFKQARMIIMNKSGGAR